MATFNSCNMSQRNRVKWRKTVVKTTIWAYLSLQINRYVPNEIFTQLLTQRPKQITNSEMDLHLRSLYWASKYFLFLYGYTIYQGTHTVAIWKGEILKYATETQAHLIFKKNFISVCFSLISFLLQHPKQVKWTMFGHENIRLLYSHHKMWLKILTEYIIKKNTLIHHPT